MPSKLESSFSRLSAAVCLTLQRLAAESEMRPIPACVHADADALCVALAAAFSSADSFSFGSQLVFERMTDTIADLVEGLTNPAHVSGQLALKRSYTDNAARVASLVDWVVQSVELAAASTRSTIARQSGPAARLSAPLTDATRRTWRSGCDDDIALDLVAPGMPVCTALPGK